MNEVSDLTVQELILEGGVVNQRLEAGECLLDVRRRLRGRLLHDDVDTILHGPKPGGIERIGIDLREIDEPTPRPVGLLLVARTESTGLRGGKPGDRKGRRIFVVETLRENKIVRRSTQGIRVIEHDCYG